MNPDLLPKITNTVGLFCDIIGAWLVAIEVVRQFKGKKQFKDQTVIVMPGCGFAEPPKKTEEFIKYERDKYRLMWIGLFFLTIGFLLQIGSNWTCFIF